MTCKSGKKTNHVDIDKLTDEPLDHEQIRPAKRSFCKKKGSFTRFQCTRKSLTLRPEAKIDTLDLDERRDASWPDIRARFVGREFKWKSPDMENTFSVTPPLEPLEHSCQEANWEVTF